MDAVFPLHVYLDDVPWENPSEFETKPERSFLGYQPPPKPDETIIINRGTVYYLLFLCRLVSV
jgi:hypothetical protein